MANRQLGRAYSILARHQAMEDNLYSDLGAYGAPSECYVDVERGERGRWRQARRAAKAASGLSRRGFNKEMAQNFNWRWIRRAADKILARDYLGRY